VVVIDFETFARIHDCHGRQGLTITQIARTLGLHRQTVIKWVARSRFEPRRSRPRDSILDPFKPHITTLLDANPHSAQQILLRLRQKGYRGGLTILRDYVRRIRPRKTSVGRRRQSGLWTRARIKEIATTCSTLSQFRKLYAAAYSIALKKGWMPEVCPHLSFAGRSSNAYTLRIEHVPPPTLHINIRKSSDKPCFVVPDNLSVDAKYIRPNWSRDFVLPGKYTLEQLSDTILSLLGWDRKYLYEFRIANHVYANLVFLDEDDPVIEIDYPCTSCDVRIRDLGLSLGEKFTYAFDFTDHHIFLLTVRDIAHLSVLKVTPLLIAYQGNNILQYPGTMSRSKEQVLKNRVPKIPTLAPIRDRCRTRFIRHNDASALREWRASNDKRNWQKAVTVLESRNQSIDNIARKIERSECQVKKWIQAFNRFGLEGLQKPDGRKGPLKPHHKRAVIREKKARRILEIVHASPNAYGINRSNWNRPSLKQAYEQECGETISISTVGALLRRSGFTIRKARKVLTSPDPLYREKVEVLLSTLRQLKPNELLFFVDELGPIRVKKYGGRALAWKNEILTYQQEQKHRGVIMMSGALSATTNQLTWIYAPAKDSLAMIDLMELLYNQYFALNKLYVTWDSASWHKSAALVDWLDAFNSTTKRLNEGPLIELIPLPISSQFLDVIEAVFSAMKRAIIHHSDYREGGEMKRAISRHFAERNAHFLRNPRRAGKKIWELDFFDDAENIRSGNYREW
jgi:transposase